MDLTLDLSKRMHHIMLKDMDHQIWKIKDRQEADLVLVEPEKGLQTVDMRTLMGRT